MHSGNRQYKKSGRVQEKSLIVFGMRNRKGKRERDQPVPVRKLSGVSECGGYGLYTPGEGKESGGN